MTETMDPLEQGFARIVEDTVRRVVREELARFAASSGMHPRTAEDGDPGKWLSVKDVAYRFGVSSKYIYRHVEMGTLPHYRFGRALRFKPAEIEKWAADVMETPR